MKNYTKSRKTSDKTSNAMVIATLALIPASVVFSAVTWDPQAPALSFAGPLGGAFLAVLTALGLKNARNLTWVALGLQAAFMTILLLTA